MKNNAVCPCSSNRLYRAIKYITASKLPNCLSGPNFPVF